VALFRLEPNQGFLLRAGVGLGQRIPASLELLDAIGRLPLPSSCCKISPRDSSSASNLETNSSKS
jgi:hypothetical protein